MRERRDSSLKAPAQPPFPHAISAGHRAIADLLPRAGNPRTHSRKQIEQIAASIRRFGFLSPILIDGGGGIIAGHGRVEGAKLLRMEPDGGRGEVFANSGGRVLGFDFDKEGRMIADAGTWVCISLV